MTTTGFGPIANERMTGVCHFLVYKKYGMASGVQTSNSKLQCFIDVLCLAPRTDGHFVCVISWRPGLHKLTTHPTPQLIH